ncbi:RimK family alpha-L-glutamate ligase, partial [bacterium]|nr:RimK family alpha-L-glutamate ligase [bacterium]
NPEIEWLSTECARILNLDIAGVDLLFDGDHFKICEVNSSPWFQGIESCCEVSIPDEIYNFIKVRLGIF